MTTSLPGPVYRLREVLGDREPSGRRQW